MAGARALPPDLAPLLARLEALLGPLSGEARPLAGGITNRNYRVTLGGEDYVVRLPGKDTDLLGISRDAERLAAQAAAALDLSPVPVAALEDCTVTRFVACSPVASTELSAAPEEIGRLLRTFHRHGPPLPNRFAVGELVAAYATVVRERGGRLPPWYARLGRVTDLVTEALAAEPWPQVPCHNDLLAGNVIRASDDAPSGRLLLVDWEYAGMGDGCFDLGNLAVNNDFDETAQDRLLRAYLDGEPAPGDHARLGLMRVLSDAREAAWGVVQGAVSQLDFDFAGYAEEHFARLEANIAEPSIAGWVDGART